MRTLTVFCLSLLASSSVFLLTGCSAEAKAERRLKTATAYFKAGDFEKAELEYRNVLQLVPNHPVANEQLSLLWIERGSTLRAMPFLQNLRTQNPDNLETRIKILQILASNGKLAETRREAIAILERSRGNPDALLLLSEAVRSPEDYATADQILKTTTDRSKPEYFVATANLALHQGDIAAAKTALQRAIAIDPKSIAAHQAMGALYFREKNLTQAGQEFKLVSELAPLRSAARLKYSEFKVQTGAPTEAIDDLKSVTKQAPDYLPAWRALAMISSAEKKYDEALDYLKKVLATDPVNYEGLLIRAQISQAKGDTKKAIEELEKIGKTFPYLAADKFQLGIAHLQAKNPKAAADAFKQAIAQNPDHEQAIVLLAQLNLQSGDAQAAALAMADLLTKRPNLEQAQLLFMNAMGALGRLDDLVAPLSKAIASSPQHPWPHYLLGLVLNRQGKTAEARQSFERALERAPDALPIEAELLGLDVKEKKFSEAKRRVQARLAKAPDAAAAHYMAAQVDLAEGQWAQAEAKLLKTLELDPNYTIAYELLLRAYIASKDQPDTAGRLESFLASRPNDPHAFALGGQVYMQTNEFAKARAAFEKHLALKPDSNAVAAINNLSYLYAERFNMPDRALELARRARELDPSSPSIADTLGWILFNRKEYPQALELIAEAATKLPTNPEIQFHLGRANQVTGHVEEARSAFQKAASSTADFPGKDEIARRLGELDEAAQKASTPSKK
ncbi:MAG: tetratricopeptide repeat protein [Opitutaceae bacterium]